MKIIDENLFYIEFGEPQPPTSFNYIGTGQMKPIYIIASDYSSAEKKATEYLTIKLNGKKTSILTEDGSLNNLKPPIIKIVSVKLISDNIIY